MLKLLLKQTLIFLLVVFPLEILGVLILPVILLFISEKKEKLPRLFRYWDNWESYWPAQAAKVGLDIDGLAGPGWYRLRNGLAAHPVSFWRLWWVRYKWLGFRNPLNYFQYRYLGMFIQYPTSAYVEQVKVGAYSWLATNKSGFFYTIIRDRYGKVHYAYYRYIEIPFQNKYIIRIRLGHKIKDIHEYEAGDVIQFVYIPFSIRTID